MIRYKFSINPSFIDQSFLDRFAPTVDQQIIRDAVQEKKEIWIGFRYSNLARDFYNEFQNHICNTDTPNNLWKVA